MPYVDKITAKKFYSDHEGPVFRAVVGYKRLFAWPIDMTFTACVIGYVVQYKTVRE